MLWFSRVSSGASVINGLALALGFYWPALSSGLPRALVILGVLGGLTWANLRGIKQASWLVNAFTIGKILPLVIFVLVGVWAADFSRVVPSGLLSLADAGTAALLLIFAYGGYEVTGVPAGEASNPRRDVPFAFVATILIVTTVMTLTAAVATGVLPDVGGTRTPIADASALLMGAAGGLLISLGSVISTTGNNMGQLLSRLTLRLRPGRARRPAGRIRSRASGLPHALRGDLVHHAWCWSRWRSAARSCSWPR